MKLLIKNIILVGILLLVGAQLCHAKELICQGSDFSLEIDYDIGPRGSDIVLFKTIAGDMVEFITKFSKETLSTRCGFLTIGSAKLKVNNNEINTSGQVTISSYIGVDCGIEKHESTIDLTINDKQINETLICH